MKRIPTFTPTGAGKSKSLIPWKRIKAKKTDLTYYWTFGKRKDLIRGDVLNPESEGFSNIRQGNLMSEKRNLELILQDLKTFVDTPYDLKTPDNFIR